MTQQLIETERGDRKEAVVAKRRPARRTQVPRPAGSDAKKAETKKQQLIRMLSGKKGADVATISAKLGWQQHTTRAALTHLRKAGYQVAAERSGGAKPSRYRITGAPEKA